MSILNVTEEVLIDNSIINYEYHTHQPYASTSYGNNDEIRIPIQQQDTFTLPSESYIDIVGKLTLADGKPVAVAKFINNGIAFLFNELRYELNGVVIDSIRNLGITSSLKSYLSFNANDCVKLENAGWFPKIIDGSKNILIDAKGNFNVCIPLKMLLGFAEDFKKIILNIKQELVLIRSNTDLDALIIGTEAVNIKIDKIQWKVPHISVGLAEQLRLTKYLDKNVEMPIAFRSWELHEYPSLSQSSQHTWVVKTATQLETPRYIIVGLQSDRKSKNTTDMSKFDHNKLKNLKVYLNSERYPYDNLNVDFDTNKWGVLYEKFANFQKSYYGKENEPIFSPAEYLEHTPIIVIDCSNQKETLQSSAVEIRIEFETKAATTTTTCAYCLILHDKMFTYSPLTKAVRQI